MKNILFLFLFFSTIETLASVPFNSLCKQSCICFAYLNQSFGTGKVSGCTVILIFSLLLPPQFFALEHTIFSIKDSILNQCCTENGQHYV